MPTNVNTSSDDRDMRRVQWAIANLKRHVDLKAVRDMLAAEIEDIDIELKFCPGASGGSQTSPVASDGSRRPLP